jgi:hypothetical protein
MRDLAPLHPASRVHLDILTDAVGIMQHAAGPVPDPAHGYCTDDVSRALQVDLLHGRELGWATVAGRARRNLDFIVAAFDPSTGRFRNFRSVDGSWLGGDASEDSQGRAMHALGDLVADGTDPSMSADAAELFTRALPATRELTALRAQASVLLGCTAVLAVRPGSAIESAAHRIASGLEARFVAPRGSTWPWPEPVLTYENALPPRALIAAGRELRSTSMVGTGLRVLDWLIDVQVAAEGHLSPIGNGWWPRGGEKSRFDQQPIEATALLLATEVAHEVTRERRYLVALERAYAWFLGDNDLRVPVADPARGACHDGLTPQGVNANQGAESTLMWLTAVEHVRRVRAAQATVPAAALARTVGVAVGSGS